MDFGMKLQSLRKEKGLSQETLAEKLNVSRQAVSKWESGAGYPEMDKLILLSDLFGVSIDYLIKDNHESGTDEQRAKSKYFMNSQKIKEYMNFKRNFAFRIAGAVSAIILSVILPIETSDNQYEMLGTMIMLMIVAVAVGILIMTGISSSRYSELEKKEINMSFNDLQEIQNQYMKFKSKFGMSIAFGVFFIIFAVAVVVFIEEYMKNENLSGSILIACVAISVFIFIYQGIKDSMYHFLVQNEQYIEEQKKEEKSLYSITMPLVAMAYLFIGFVYGWWHPGWIIFPVVAIITAFIERIRFN
ncbi:helix-turn-helix domain-containing protein [Candidatus Stoquefichus massiliensis]|uniref:helix-turn-helix domain-containing protein n=1 Tax=Candidatus Stoquefichus massiliensis TaxID=1470350 RepID=UPI000484C033|nr:helix-turn-helix domain-containing protein [Candidatus Stoquefichus massiliensis]